MALAAVLSVSLIVNSLPDRMPNSQALSLLFAYESLGFLLFTLVIGPLNVALGRRNPVSTDIRRDAGLVAAGAAFVHVFFSLQHHFRGRVSEYFFVTAANLPIRHDVFGIGVWLGVLATLLLLGLAAISNDASLRALGRRWKTLQRANYFLASLVVLHTVAFWHALSRGFLARVVTLLATGLVIGFQLVGVLICRRLLRPVGRDGG